MRTSELYGTADRPLVHGFPLESFPPDADEQGRMRRGAFKSNLPKIERYDLKEEVLLKLKAGRMPVKGILTVIDSKEPVIEIEGDRYRIDIFRGEIVIKRPKQEKPYLEIRR